MSKDTQSREGDCQIASFGLSQPQIVGMDCRRNIKDELKGIWQSWDEAKKTYFRDKYGNVAQLLFIKPYDALLKRKVPNDVAELTEKIRNLEMHLRRKNEKVRQQREQHQAYEKEKEEEIMRQ
ncbi:hypothetical protein PVK06_005230 [Gossypium arboreum]|uniref:Uncharacterized protein n=1 Tax=Gossypium arboreum TaxID=29729 RepID=A0ABR0QVC7_GOSAR|nr:hypothetical protein PVK06_005230 [Gossypium arboreum]